MKITDVRRVGWTRNLVLAGIVLGYLSYGSYKLGLGEMYPFAHWRLFSAPIGINEPTTTYRIYLLDSVDGDWQRRSFEQLKGFPRKEQGYVLSYWSQRVLEDSSDTEARRGLEATADALMPRAPAYQVVAETFYSLPLYADSSQYDTTVVARFTR